MKILRFKTFLRVIYVTAFAILMVIFIIGLPYYFLPVSERPHSSMHDQLKPGGSWGHGLGIVGSAMILMLLLYSVRKRGVFGIRYGSLSHWLDIHIFLGIIGPLLITLHTAMKFRGIITISYFSMVAVAISGVFGRYVYMQIPRDSRGHALGLDSIRERVDEIQRIILEQHNASPETVQAIKQFISAESVTVDSKIRAIFESIVYDLTIKRRVRKLRRSLSRGRRNLPRGMLRKMVVLARESSMLQRKIAYLDAMNELSHYWHVFHKPFAYIMLIIMIVHVGITVAFGYRWIF